MKRPGRWHAAAICRTCAFDPLAATSRLIRNGVKPTRRLTSAFIALACFANSQPSPASETITYTYDARGRVVQVSHGGLNQGATATYQYDKADNRANVSVITSWASPAMRTGDFNGDGRADILWRDDTPFDAFHGPGTITDWLSSSSGGWIDNWSNAANWADISWKIAAVADINGDGRSDILWRCDDGRFAEWLTNASGGFTGTGPWGGSETPAWKIIGTADFNGDGRPDILWRHDDGTIKTWLGQANGSFVNNNIGNVGNEWSVAGVGDFNGDGRGDILWLHANGTLTDWLGQTNGTFVDNWSNLAANVPSDWHIVGTGDFNGDGRSDILLRHDGGTLSEWQGTSTGGQLVTSYYWGVPTNYRVAAIGNFNGPADQRDDIVWRNTAGELVEWQATSTGEFVGLPSSWAGTNWNVEPRWAVRPSNP